MSSEAIAASKANADAKTNKAGKKSGRSAPSPLVAVGRGGGTGKAVKAGSNWKRLQKTFGKPGESSRKRSVSTTSTKPRADGSVGAVPSSSSSPERSSLKGKGKSTAAEPWFADDLSPEDLALIKSGKDVSSSAALGGVVEGADEEVDEETMRKRKRAILGEPDLSKEKSEPGTYVAVDCEMVGVGPNGSESVLARVSLVNWHGASILDTFVRPREKVTDYRTWVSGVRPSDLKNAPSFQEVQDQVSTILKGRVLIGHAVQNDLKALLLSHPRPLLRDTSTFEPLRKLAKTKRPALRKLAKLVLGIDMQQKGEEHSSVQDARATMAIYRQFHAQWQESLGFSNKKGIAALQKGKRKRKESNGDEEAIIGGEPIRDIDGSRHAKKLKKADALAPNWWKDL